MLARILQKKARHFFRKKCFPLGTFVNSINFCHWSADNCLFKLPNRHTSGVILMVFLLLFCDGFIFDTLLMLFREHTLQTLEHIMNSERRYSGVNFEFQLLLHVPSEMQIGEANVIFAGDVEHKLNMHARG